MLYKVLKALTLALIKVIFRIEVEGKENIPLKGPLIIASNHVSNLDPVVLGAVLPRRVSFMAKKELFSHRIFARFLKKLEAFPVRRGKADISAMKEASYRLQKGGALILFPQGRRSAVLEAGGLLSGVGFLAKTTQAWVLPARIFGTDKALPPKTWLLRPAKVRIKFSRPLKFSAKEGRQQIAQEIFNAIKNIS